jgi:diadenosine tetraphosphate (Ap4A) HIT family hydrolase
MDETGPRVVSDPEPPESLLSPGIGARYPRVVTDVPGCIACDLTNGRRELPGGPIYQTDHWRVEHCIGPLGVGTLLVKPLRHVVRMADLTTDESAEMGSMLQRTSSVVGSLTNASQVYVCLWSHGPAHIHFVVQPETDAIVASLGTWGPSLHAAMFKRDQLPARSDVEQFADHARRAFSPSG